MLKLIFNYFSLLTNDRPLRNSIFIISSFSLLVGVFFSIGAALNILLSYISGFAICYLLTKYNIASLINLQRLSILIDVSAPATSPASTVVCSICKKGSCNRHNIIYNARNKLQISYKLNHTVEHLYNQIIALFVSSWYRDVTADALFLNELRTGLKYASSSIVHKFMQLDICKIISKKLLPCAAQHIEDYSHIQEIARVKNVEVNDVAIEYLGSRLHIAATNRKNELNYIRQLASFFLPHLLSVQNIKCKNYFVLMREIITGWILLPLVDVLADPNNINSLVILVAIKFKAKINHMKQNQLKFVKFLSNFAKKDLKCSKLTSDLKSILNRTDLLYAFMQFLKNQGPVHILQFCLDIESFNNKLLIPDMSKKQLEALHAEALKLNDIYFNRQSIDYIECSPEIEHQFQQILLEGSHKVAKLQTSEALYRAYDYSFSLLETKWLPLFFRSSEFYSYLFGSKITPIYNKLNSKTKEKRIIDNATVGTVSKISSSFERIKGVLKSNQPVDGAIYLPEFQIYVDGPGAFVENIFLSNCENVFRDLSTWRITIPSVDTQQLANSKAVHIFNINIQRVDALLENEMAQWVVSRKDQDFHLLKTKLIEFHGENEICGLTASYKRAGMSLENRRTNYEDFLKLLLQKSSLQNSDLLYTFLTTNRDFTLVVTNAVPVVEDFGNIYQSVAFKFRKEKGQHLDLFMNTFLASTGNFSSNKFEWGEVGKENEFTISDINIPVIPATYHNEVFVDNFGISQRNKNGTDAAVSLFPNNATEAIFHLLNSTFKINPSVCKMYVGLCNVLPKSIESMTDFYINRNLHLLLSQDNFADLVALLEDVILQSHISPTAEERKKKKLRAFKELSQFLPYYMQEILGEDFSKGLLHILNILQNPQFNKQLIYTLLDVVVCELNEDLK